jgi:hypothetical protein
MNNFFANIIILLMLGYIYLFYGYFSLFKLFHPTLFMVIINFLLILVISP